MVPPLFFVTFVKSRKIPRITTFNFLFNFILKCSHHLGLVKLRTGALRCERNLTECRNIRGTGGRSFIIRINRCSFHFPLNSLLQDSPLFHCSVHESCSMVTINSRIRISDRIFLFEVPLEIKV